MTARLRSQRIQVRHHRMGQQQSISRQPLPLTHDREGRRQLGNGRRQGACAAALDQIMDGGHGHYFSRALAIVAASTGGAEFPKFERMYVSNAAASSSFIQPNNNIWVG